MNKPIESNFTSHVAYSRELEKYVEMLEAKLKEQSGDPVAWAVLEGRDIDSSAWGFIASWPEICHETINDAINEHHNPEAKDWRVVPLYTHSPRDEQVESLKAKLKVAESALDTCTFEGFCDYDACSEALAKIRKE
jgi:hypothetical protein